MSVYQRANNGQQVSQPKGPQSKIFRVGFPYQISFKYLCNSGNRSMLNMGPTAIKIYTDFAVIYIFLNLYETLYVLTGKGIPVTGFGVP